MREEVLRVVQMGKLPSISTPDDDPKDDEALEYLIDLFAERILEITRPVTVEEATALVHVFGTDDCGGVAWTLLHRCEYLKDLEDPPDAKVRWIETLKIRAKNSGNFECL